MPRLALHEIDRADVEAEWWDRPAIFGQIVAVAERQMRSLMTAGTQQSRPTLGIGQRNPQFVDLSLACFISDRHECPAVLTEACRRFERQVERPKRKMLCRLVQGIAQGLPRAASATANGNADVQQFNGPQDDDRRQTCTKLFLPPGDARPILIRRMDGKEDGMQERQDVVAQRLEMERIGK